MLAVILLVGLASTLTPGQADETVARRNHTLPSSSFDEIIIDGPFDVFLSQSSVKPPSVDFETSSDLHRLILVELVDQHILHIHSKHPLIVHRSIPTYIHFSSPLRRYTIKGTGNTVTNDTAIRTSPDERFVLDNRGTANVALQLDVGEFEAYLFGTGNSRFWGHARERTTINSKGVGDVNAVNLLTKKVKVDSSGVSTVRVAATEDAEIEVTGVSTVYYRLPAGKKPSRATFTGLGHIIRFS